MEARRTSQMQGVGSPEGFLLAIKPHPADLKDFFQQQSLIQWASLDDVPHFAPTQRSLNV